MEELENKPRDIPLDITYASEELDTNLTDSIIFGVEWNKIEWNNKDTFEANLKTTVKKNTKRGMLKLMVSIFDPLSIITTITLMFKEMYRQSCDLKLPSDGEFPTFLLKNRIKWSESLPQQTEVPRSILLFNNAVQSVELHLSGDADKTGVSADFQREIFQYQDLSWLLHILLPIVWEIQDIQSRFAIDGLAAWWFLTGYMKSSATNN